MPRFPSFLLRKGFYFGDLQSLTKFHHNKMLTNCWTSPNWILPPTRGIISLFLAKFECSIVIKMRDSQIYKALHKCKVFTRKLEVSTRKFLIDTQRAGSRAPVLTPAQVTAVQQKPSCAPPFPFAPPLQVCLALTLFANSETFQLSNANLCKSSEQERYSPVLTGHSF